jgi:hypothetical protein
LAANAVREREVETSSMVAIAARRAPSETRGVLSLVSPG